MIEAEPNILAPNEIISTETIDFKITYHTYELVDWPEESRAIDPHGKTNRELAEILYDPSTYGLISLQTVTGVVLIQDKPPVFVEGSNGPDSPIDFIDGQIYTLKDIKRIPNIDNKRQMIYELTKDTSLQAIRCRDGFYRIFRPQDNNIVLSDKTREKHKKMYEERQRRLKRHLNV